ncbi:MAG: hypothetical protein ACKOAU_07475, partial [Pirellula sp.]
VANGDLIVDTLGDLIANRAVTLTNADENDITLRAGGNMQLVMVKAGDFAETASQAFAIRLGYLNALLRSSGYLSINQLDLTESDYQALDRSTARGSLLAWMQQQSLVDAEAQVDRILNLTQPIYSLGDISLESGGAITGPIGSVSLVGDNLMATSNSGLKLRVALNSIASVRNQSGSLELVDVAGVGEAGGGLNVGSLTDATSGIFNVSGPISIETSGSLDAIRIRATGTTGSLTLNVGGTLVPTSEVYAQGSYDWTFDEISVAGNMLNLSTNDSIRITSGASLVLAGTLEAGKDIELVSKKGDVRVVGTIRGKGTDALDSLAISAFGNMMESGPFKGMYRFQSLPNRITYYSNTPVIRATSYVVDGNNIPLTDLMLRDLVPYTMVNSTIIKDSQSGMDIYRDPQTGGIYYYSQTSSGNPGSQLGNSLTGSFLQWRENGLYMFSGYNLLAATTPGVDALQRFYSTTGDPTQGILYMADALTTIDQSSVVSLQPYYVPLSDTDIRGRLVPLTMSDSSNGQGSGTSISLEQAAISVQNTLKLLSYGQVSVPDINVPGTIDITTADDLVWGNWRAANIRGATQGFVDGTGGYHPGHLTISKTISNPSGGAAQSVDFNAHGNLILDAVIQSASGLGLKAGMEVLGRPASINVSGANGFIDFSNGKDLVINGPLTSTGPITLSSLGEVGPDGIRTGGSVKSSSNITSTNGPVTVESTDTDSVLSGSISGTGFDKKGSGTLTITGSLSGVPKVQINDGKLVLNGTANAVDVGPGSKLGGTGTLNGTLSVNSGATLSPGTSPGIMTVNGDVNFQSNAQNGSAVLEVELNGTVPGTDYDQIVVMGANRTVTLTGTELVVIEGANIAVGTRYTIIKNVDATSRVVGTFTNAPEDGGIVSFGSV